MGKQTVVNKELMQLATLQKELNKAKEALEIHRLKEEIIGNILAENNPEKLRNLADASKKQKLMQLNTKKNPLQGNS
jgi:hypothetical protein